MALGKNILNQYVHLIEEQKTLKTKIRNTERQITELCKETVADSVTLGKHGKKPLGRKVIRGNPTPLINRKRAALQKYKMLLAENETEALETLVEVQQYIGKIDDSRIRRIIQYRYVEKLTWQQTANRMGKHHTADSCRMAIERFFKEK